LQPDAA
jgi:hypothetical protein